MEEFVGGLWDRLIRRAARTDHPDSGVRLAEVERTIAALFRAFGGSARLRLAAAADSRHGARRRLLARLAHVDEKSAVALRDGESLRLPERIALFPDASLNRDLYLWLVALAARREGPPDDWFAANQRATAQLLAEYPGLAPRYRRLVDAVVARRIGPGTMRPDEALQEIAVRHALAKPGSVSSLPPLLDRRSRPIQPVPLWVQTAESDAPRQLPGGRGADPPSEAAPSEPGSERRRRSAERDTMPDNESPMVLLFRAESLFSCAEYVKVNRDTDDEPDAHASRAAEDIDRLTVTRDAAKVASKIRFDLDLPSAAEDDEPVGDGLPLPEWDHRRGAFRADWCRLQTLRSRGAARIALPDSLQKPARRLKSQFAALAPARAWARGQPDGDEPDIDAAVRARADRAAGGRPSGGLYLARRRRERDLACLVLADLSLSTDAWVGDRHRVIDVIRNALMLFSEALSATGDAFALYGFSSLKRGRVRFHEVKRFDERYDAGCRGRIASLKPGFYTRMGAAVRGATAVLSDRPESQRVLMILSDGKPNDIDGYEGRYAVEDTRMSVVEARRAGLRPFCVTVDREGAGYLPHMFGVSGYTVVRRPEDLPTRLPALYGQLTSA